MNKQELIKKYEMKGEQLKEFPVVAIGDVLKNLRELDEPKKVQIPQFVASWIEECKAKEKRLLTALLYTPEKVNSWVDNSENQELFARAWLDGYEVEKEKRYLVKFKGFNPSYIILKHHQYDNTCFLGGEQEYEFYRLHHTHKELEEANFGWVFSCEGVEVEEVE